jgi:serine/threonine-protein kinase
VTTGRLFEPGVPDFQAELAQAPLLAVLARLRLDAETGALFVERHQSGDVRRKEVYLDQGRLLHVASSDPTELFGEYLVRRGRLSREQLDTALTMLSNYGGRLGDTLIGMEWVEAIDVFRAIRDQGRDRVAAVCSWSHGRLTFYRGTVPGHVEFRLDLDLASAMMAGTIALSRGRPRALLPDGKTRIAPGPRVQALATRHERGTAPTSLQRIADRASDGLTIDAMLAALTGPPRGPGERPISQREACAALVTAGYLGWVAGFVVGGAAKAR